MSTKAGVLRQTPSRKLWIEGRQKRCALGCVVCVRSALTMLPLAASCDGVSDAANKRSAQCAEALAAC